MPIDTRPPQAEPAATVHPVAAPRPGGGASSGDDRSPSRDLLPLGGFLVPAPAPAPDRALALDALRLLHLLRDPRPRPARWTEPRFRRQVERARRQLAPLHSRVTLADSFGREACLDGSSDAHGDDAPRSLRGLVHPVRIAYAIRWLEIGDGIPRPGWRTLLERRD
jgi:hypothetical protein